MTTYVSARDALVALIHNAWTAQYPTVPVFYENAIRVDLDKAGESFLKVDIEFDKARQMTIELAPRHRVIGAIVLTLFAKDGTGVRTTLERLDFLTNVAKFKDIAGVKLQTPQPGSRAYKNGWRSYELIVPFWFDAA